MRIYEELFIMKPDVVEEEIDAFIEQMKTHVSTAGGTVDKVEKWGKRRLAYKVEKFREGSYVLLQFTAGSQTVKEVERRLRVADPVIKFLTVRIDESMKRIEKRKKEREKRAHRRATQPRSESPVPMTPLFGEPDAVHAAPGAPVATPAATHASPAAPPAVAPGAPAAPAKEEGN